MQKRDCYGSGRDVGASPEMSDVTPEIIDIKMETKMQNDKVKPEASARERNDRVEPETSVRVHKDRMELLAPAGDLEKLRYAIEYGADAVYFGGEIGSLRAGAGNLTIPEIYEGIKYAHDRNKKAYLTLNIYAHAADMEPLTAFLREVREAKADGYIISDPGVIYLVKSLMPEAVIHLSTQASMTNALAARFWRDAGVRRLVVARELSLAEIKILSEESPEMEIEAFVHGALCISYSGRCLLSAVMTGRDANRGECAHPCRYNYALMEEKRPGEYFPVEEDDRGTYIMNSKDLCMIAHIPELAAAGIGSLKIEGRMKSLYYVAATVKAYRQALDSYYGNCPLDKCGDADVWLEELSKASHRPYTTGFYFGKPDGSTQSVERSGYITSYSFIGVVKSYDPLRGVALIEQRNKMSVGETIEIFGPDMDSFVQTIEEIRDEEGQLISSAPHAQQLIQMPMKHPVKENYILRRRQGNTI
jgi:putative protease